MSKNLSQSPTPVRCLRNRRGYSFSPHQRYVSFVFSRDTTAFILLFSQLIVLVLSYSNLYNYYIIVIRHFEHFSYSYYITLSNYLEHFFYSNETLCFLLRAVNRFIFFFLSVSTVARLNSRACFATKLFFILYIPYFYIYNLLYQKTKNIEHFIQQLTQNLPFQHHNQDITIHLVYLPT